MKNKICLFVLVVCLSGLFPAVAMGQEAGAPNIRVKKGARLINRQASPLEQTVLKAEQSWIDALLKSDTAALEALYADTLVYTHSSGGVDDKAKYIAAIKSGATKYLSIDREDVKVNVYGDAAVVTCKVLMKILANGENRTVNARMIHVYAKQKGRWQMVAHQTTRLG